MQDTIRDWARAAGVRAVKTAAQAALANLGAASASDLASVRDSVSPIHFNTGTPAISKLDFFSWNDESVAIDVYRAETGHKMRISFSSSGVSFDPNPAN